MSEPMPGISRGLVRVTIPASVAFDLGKFQKAVGNVLGRLGCPGCTSGHEILFQQEAQFIVDENLRVTPVAEVGGLRE
jgi:hypothetical protein